MELVYRAASVVDAQLVSDLLAEAGIVSEVTGHYLSGAIGELPPSDVVGVRILNPDDKGRARALIEDWELSRKRVRDDWFCRQCGERIGGAFGACWQCGAPEPD